MGLNSIYTYALTGINAENLSVDVAGKVNSAYRVSTNTSAEITGDKTIAFSGTPVEGLTVLTFIIEGGINTAGASKLKIGGVTIPDLFALNKSTIVFEFFGGAWIQHYSMSGDQTGSINGANLVNDTVTPVKLTDAIAGSGMDRDGAGGVLPKLEASNPSMQIVSAELGVKLNATGAITKTASGVGVNLESSNPTLQIATNQLGLKIAPDEGLETGANGVSVKVVSGGGIEKGGSGLILGPITYHIIASFETGAANGFFQVKIPYKSTVGTILGMVSKDISGTDDGEIILKAANSFGGAASPLAGPYEITMSSSAGSVAIGDTTGYDPSSSGAWYLQVEANKATAGGQVYLSIDIIPIP